MSSASDAPRFAALQYEIQEIISTNDPSTVMKVTDRRLGGGTYALKIIKRESADDDLSIEWARAECEGSAKLQHPAILKTHDFRMKKKWLVVPDRAEQLMEYVEGKPLDKVTRIKVAQAALLFHKLAGALNHMHRREVLHGDIRPRKILLARNGQVKLRGYGFSLVNFKLKEMYKAKGPYVAPERAKEPVATITSDIYSLAATMYHILAGRAPAGLVARTEGKKLEPARSINSKVPEALDELLTACLSLNAEARPQNAYEVSQVTEKVVKSIGIDDEILVGLATGEGR